jgi:hypothetical protein
MSSSINFKRLENQFSTHRSNMEQKKFDDYLKSLNTFLHIMKWTWQRTFSQQQLMKVYFDWSNINKNEDLF